jgi:hypothetical protein
VVGVIECGAAGRAQAGLLSPETGRDGAHIGDLARTQTVDVGRTGPALFRRALGAGGAGCEESKEESERGRLPSPAGRSAGFGDAPSKSRLHDRFALVFAATQWRVV